MKTEMNRKLKVALTIVVSLALVLTPFGTVQAALLTSLSDTLSRHKISTASNHTIKFTTPTGVDAATDTITVTFPAGFTMGTVAFGDMDLSHGATTGYETEETLAATPAVGVWGAAVSGQVVTFTAPTGAAAGEITAADKVVVEIGTNASGGANQITNPGTTGSKRIDIGGVFGDTGSIAVAINADDQVVVTATVDPSITFTVTGLTVSLSNMTPTVNGEDIKDDHLTVDTNADDGYTISGWCTSTGNTLRDADGNTISWVTDGDTAITAGTEEWGIKFTAGTGGRSGSTSSPADYRALDTQEADLALNSTTPVADDDTKATYGAAVAALTEAGTYTATVTYIATGNF